MAQPRRSLWARFRDKYAIRRMWTTTGGPANPLILKIPDRGFCVATPDHYYACFTSRPHARHGAQLLANAINRRVDLVRVENRGEDRDVVAEFKPRGRAA